jgi:hypothetical protein
MMAPDFASIRANIAAALDGLTVEVDGTAHTLTATATTPKTIEAYCAWPVIGDARPFTMCLAETDWFVYVALPAGDQESTVAAADALYAPVCDALMTLGQVTHTRPRTVPVADGGADVPAWQYEVTI